MSKKEKILQLTFYFLLVTFFFQTRYAFFARNQLIDYLIPFVYLSDVLILFLLIQTLLFYRCRISNWIKSQGKKSYFLLLTFYLLLSAVSNLYALHPLGAWYKWLKMVEFSLFSFWLAWFLTRQQQETSNPKPFTSLRFRASKRQEKRVEKGKAGLLHTMYYLLLNLGLVIECLIAWGEWLTQKSLGLQFLGEWRFSVLTPGIARVILFGKEYLRPYATFPHPNVFGGILAIMAPVNLFLFLQELKAQGKRKKVKFLLFTSYFLLLSSTLLITFSRSAWLAYAVLMFLIFFYWGWQFRKKLNLSLVFGLIVFLLFTIYFLLFTANPISQRLGSFLTTDQLALKQRLELNAAALLMIRDNLFFGVGCNNFIPNLENYRTVSGVGRWLQPVHNVPLLILTENGIVGFIIFSLFLANLIYDFIRNRSTVKKFSILNSQFSILLMWLGIFITSLFDHYWWTLQQGQLILWLGIGLTLVR